MQKRGLYIFFIIVLSFILIQLPLNSAIAPVTDVTINLNDGLNIDFPKFETIQQSQGFLFHFHVFNISNGVRMDDTTTNCSFELYNYGGEEQVVVDEMAYIEGDWRVNITKGNFTRLGSYAYLVECHTDTLGGFISFPFKVTPTGTTINTSESLLYIIILIVTFILFLGFLYPAIKLPYSNRTNKDGSITKITKAKYLKLLSVWFAYGFFMWFLQTLNGISKSFITLTYLSNFITNIFIYSQWFSVGVTFLILIIMFIEIWKDIILSKTIKKYGKAFLDGRLQ